MIKSIYFVRSRLINYTKPNNVVYISSMHKQAEEKYFNVAYQSEIYKWWEESGFFKPNNNGIRTTYTIPMPPPNVTGSLHMGHALFASLQDILARYKRMSGYSVLWLPGTDHAGIATQVVVEREIAKNSNGTLSRLQMGREAFEKEVWKWRNSTGGYITKQLRLLGASADWSKETFTLDPHMCKAVFEAFKRLHDKGLVYRGLYMIHWSPALQTALSDLEVDHTEEDGYLYYFKYNIDGDSAYIPVATTRPETILGDTAVCVHPLDERYKHLIGKYAVVPVVNRIIPVIADDMVDMSFGTGALKVTPGHDVIDYELHLRHGLEVINILNKDVTINHVGENVGYAGMDRFACRERIWEDMKNLGLTLGDPVSHKLRVPRSQRTGEIVEPMVSSQWFVDVKDMAAKAVNLVKTKQIIIVPERFEKTWYSWLDASHIKSWCISRQLWWGHRIPVYYIVGSNRSRYVIAQSYEEAVVEASRKFGLSPSEVSLELEEDVLDTWFSSGLWPFATVGWPEVENTKDSKALKLFKDRYPASILETGYDILFFWVARMVMMGIELTGLPPFKHIYLHGLVKDEKGQKMSKSKGNIIDPVGVVESHGCDVLRYTLVSASCPSSDIALSKQSFDLNRAFMNKVWNIGKYVEHVMNTTFSFDEQNYVCQTADRASTGADSVEIVHKNMNQFLNSCNSLFLGDLYILTRILTIADQVKVNLDEFKFMETGKLLYDFIWREFADEYLEIHKLEINHLKNMNADPASANFVLMFTWLSTLKIFHPYMPFITEILWQSAVRERNSTNFNDKNTLMAVLWPGIVASEGKSPTSVDLILNLFMHVKKSRLYTSNCYSSKEWKDKIAYQYDLMMSLVRGIRNIRAEHKVGSKILLNNVTIIVNESFDLRETLKNELPIIAGLCKVSTNGLKFVSKDESVGITGVTSVINEILTIVVEIPEKSNECVTDTVIDDKKLEKAVKQRDSLLRAIESFESQLQNEEFLSKASPSVIARSRDILNKKKIELAAVLALLK